MVGVVHMNDCPSSLKGSIKLLLMSGTSLWMISTSNGKGGNKYKNSMLFSKKKEKGKVKILFNW